MKIFGIIGGVLLALALLGWGIYLVIGMVDCWSKWRRSGMDYEYTTFSGCLLEIEPEKWIPDDRYRGLEE